MKKTIVLSLFGAMLGIVLCSSSGGYGTNRTGSRGGTSGCGNCHGSSTALGTTMELDSAGVPVTSYIPGMSYTVKIKATNNTGLNLPRFGFQMSVVKATGAGTTSATAAGTWSSTLPAGVQNTGGTQGLIEQSQRLSPASGTGANGTIYSVSVDWTAPQTGTGSVKLYGIMNAVNTSPSSDDNGDKYQMASAVTITETPAVAKPVAAFTANALSGTTSTVFTLTDQSTNAPTSWQWTCTPANATYVGGTSSTSQNPQVQFSAAGQYTVKLRTANVGGADSITKTAYITVGPNGIEEINSTVSAVKAFPVPMSGNMNVSFDLNEASPVTINLVSLNGQVVKNLYNEKASAGTFNHSFDVSDLTMGVYLLQIKTAGTYINKQVVKL